MNHIDNEVNMQVKFKFLAIVVSFFELLGDQDVPDTKKLSL